MKVTLKLPMLLALTSAAKTSKICYLDIRYLIKQSSDYISHFDNNTKTSSKPNPRKYIKFHPFTENKKLCVCTTVILRR